VQECGALQGQSRNSEVVVESSLRCAFSRREEKPIRLFFLEPCFQAACKPPFHLSDSSALNAASFSLTSCPMRFTCSVYPTICFLNSSMSNGWINLEAYRYIAGKSSRSRPGCFSMISCSVYPEASNRSTSATLRFRPRIVGWSSLFFVMRSIGPPTAWPTFLGVSRNRTAAHPVRSRLKP